MSKTQNPETAPRKVLAYSVETNDPEESTIKYDPIVLTPESSR